MTEDFIPFPKMARLSRDIVITEKLDGTNAQVVVSDDGEVRAGSRNRWISPTEDNYGFARWVQDNADELRLLGPGRHYGEWWGCGIQRGYGFSGQDAKQFSLFNVHRWDDPVARPACCNVVPTLYRGLFSEEAINQTLVRLRNEGSAAAPGFMNPEGVIIFHTANGTLFKKTLENDEAPKSKVAA